MFLKYDLGDMFVIFGVCICNFVLSYKRLDYQRCSFLKHNLQYICIIYVPTHRRNLDKVYLQRLQRLLETLSLYNNNAQLKHLNSCIHLCEMIKNIDKKNIKYHNYI